MSKKNEKYYLKADIKKMEKEDESLKEQIWERGQELKKEFCGNKGTV